MPAMESGTSELQEFCFTECNMQVWGQDKNFLDKEEEAGFE